MLLTLKTKRNTAHFDCYLLKPVSIICVVRSFSFISNTTPLYVCALVGIMCIVRALQFTVLKKNSKVTRESTVLHSG